jgi:hypothetical protein
MAEKSPFQVGSAFVHAFPVLEQGDMLNRWKNVPIVTIAFSCGQAKAVGLFSINLYHIEP